MGTPGGEPFDDAVLPHGGLGCSSSFVCFHSHDACHECAKWCGTIAMNLDDGRIRGDFCVAGKSSGTIPMNNDKRICPRNGGNTLQFEKLLPILKLPRFHDKSVSPYYQNIIH